MLLSSSKTKQTPGAQDSAPRKLHKSSKLQTTRPKVLLSSSSSSSGSDSDDVTVKTPPRHPDKKQPTQRVVKLRYQVNAEASSHQNHVNFLQYLTHLNDSNLVIQNKRSKTLKSPAVIALQNLTVYQNHFDHHQDEKAQQDGKRYVTVIQSFQTVLTVAEIKRLPGVMECLKSNQIYMTTHDWLSDVWNVKTIGFLTRFSPSHHPKSLATEYLNTKLKQEKQMPKFRMRHTFISSMINHKTVRVPVYAIEVQTHKAWDAEKVILQKFEDPDAYISFRMKSINQVAFRNAVALVAQHQNDLRTIVVNNVSSDAYFTLEAKAKQVDKVLTVHHLVEKESMRIVTYDNDVIKLRQHIWKLLPTWIDNLDPSDLRSCKHPPTMAPTKHDDLSEQSASDLSNSIQSLLSFDIYELTIFQGPTAPKTNPDVPPSDVTMSNTEERITQQQIIIENQGKQIEDLLKMIEEMKATTENKIDKLITMVTTLTNSNKTGTSNNDNIKNTTATSKWRPQ
jgi:hypothetical protein